MAKPKKYQVTWPAGLVGFNGVIFKEGEIIESDKVPAPHLRVWIRFKQVEEIQDTKSEDSGQTSEKKGKKS